MKLGINRWTFIVMDAVLESNSKIRDNTLIVSSINKKLHIIKDIHNTKNIKKMLTDYIKLYNRDIPLLYIILNGINLPEGIQPLPFFYFSKLNNDNYRMLLPDYNLPKYKKKDIHNSNNKTIRWKSHSFKNDITHSPFDFVRSFANADADADADANEGAIVKILHPKKECALLDQMFIPGVDYIISDDMSNYVPGSGINKYKNLTNKNILRVLDEVLYNYTNRMIRYKDIISLVPIKGRRIGTGYTGQIYDIINEPDKVIKSFEYKNSLISQSSINEGIIFSILADNPMFLPIYHMNYGPEEAIFVIEKADCNLQEYYDNNTMTKQIWKKIYTDVYTSIMELHRLNISHNDIKPANIMYSKKRDKFFLIDFGSASLLKLEDNDIKRFISIPDYLRRGEVIKSYNIQVLIDSIPPNIYNKTKIYSKKHKYKTDEERKIYLQTFAALYYIQKHNLFKNTYPNKLFTLHNNI